MKRRLRCKILLSCQNRSVATRLRCCSHISSLFFYVSLWNYDQCITRSSATSAPETHVQRANTTLLAMVSIVSSWRRDPASAAYPLLNHDQGQAFTFRRNGLVVSLKKNMAPSFEDTLTSVKASSPGREWGDKQPRGPAKGFGALLLYCMLCVL